MRNMLRFALIEHLRCIVNSGSRLTAKKRPLWCKQVFKLKILKSGQAKSAV